MEEIFYDMVFKRKSFHLFRNVGNEKIIPAELESINEIYKRLMQSKEADIYHNCRRFYT